MLLLSGTAQGMVCRLFHSCRQHVHARMPEKTQHDRSLHAWHRCGASEFSPGGQLFFTPLVQALRTMLHLGETVPEGYAGAAFHISAGSLALWMAVVFPLMLLSIGIGAASGASPSHASFPGTPLLPGGRVPREPCPAYCMHAPCCQTLYGCCRLHLKP